MATRTLLEDKFIHFGKESKGYSVCVQHGYQKECPLRLKRFFRHGTTSAQRVAWRLNNKN